VPRRATDGAHCLGLPSRRGDRRTLAQEHLPALPVRAAMPRYT
jgi:hypothetical protein